MSRNFELLQRLETERQRRESTGRPDRKPDQRSRRAPEPQQPEPQPEVKHAAVAPEIERLAHSLFLLPGTATPQVVVFAEVEGRQQPSHICVRVAEALAAHTSGTICVVDANLAKPSLASYFHLENHLGLTDMLLESLPLEACAPLNGGRLTVVPAGSAYSGWQRLLGSESMQWRLREMRERFDHVLIDAPPLATCPQSHFLGRLSDGVVMILEANSTRRDMAVQLRQELEQAKVKVLGAVLNNIAATDL
jgi:Mrp family chromosome partitioning ATPase